VKSSSPTSEVNNVGNSSIPFSHDDDDLGDFENHTTGIGSILMKNMGYEGEGLGANGFSIKILGRCTEIPHLCH